VFSRLVARAITGPPAFFVAGVIDICAFAVAARRSQQNHKRAQARS
jgi:hypothetical protein